MRLANAPRSLVWAALGWVFGLALSFPRMGFGSVFWGGRVQKDPGFEGAWAGPDPNDRGVLARTTKKGRQKAG